MKDESRARFPESVAVIGRRREIARQELAARNQVLPLLAEKGPLTVPEVARALGVSAMEANWWLMGYARYGKVKAGDKADDDGYYHYALVEVK